MPSISSLITITGLLDCYPTVHKYSLSTIQHECWRGGGTWLSGHHQGFDKGFDKYQGFTNGFSAKLQPSTGTHQNSLKIFSSSTRAWRVGTHSKVYLTKMVIPHDWSICSISWVPSDEGSTSSGTPLVQLQRNERRIRRVPSSLWSFYTAQWITLYLRDAGYTSWKRSG